MSLLQSSIPEELPEGVEMGFSGNSVQYLPFTEQIISAGGTLSLCLDGDKIFKFDLGRTYGAKIKSVSRQEVEILTWGASCAYPNRLLIFKLNEPGLISGMEKE